MLVIWCVGLVFPGFGLIVFGVVLGWFALWSELVVLFCWYLVVCLVFALLMFGCCLMLVWISLIVLFYLKFIKLNEFGEFWSCSWY